MPRAAGCRRSQRVMPVSRAASSRTSNTLARRNSSSGVSKSASSVPRPAWFKAAATNRSRGLRRLLPLPRAKMTAPVARSGMARCAASSRSPAVKVISRSKAGGSGATDVAVSAAPPAAPLPPVRAAALFSSHRLREARIWSRHPSSGTSATRGSLRASACRPGRRRLSELVADGAQQAAPVGGRRRPAGPGWLLLIMRWHTAGAWTPARARPRVLAKHPVPARRARLRDSRVPRASSMD